MAQEIGRLHVISDARDARSVSSTCGAVVAAGAPVIQLRYKPASDAALFELATELVELCGSTGASLIVNDRCDIALAAGAAGAHLGADDLPTHAARRVLGNGPLLGATCRNPRSAVRAQTAGADYLGVGPTFATSTKTGLPDPLGIDSVGAVAAAVDIPVIAVGGITADHVPDLLAAGVFGVAVAGAVFSADDPGRATRELVDTINAFAGEHA